MLFIGDAARAKEMVAEVYLPAVSDCGINSRLLCWPHHNTAIIVVRCVAVIALYAV